ncbi:MAG: DUF1127 domain-containing protein [Paracoccaceae bacterium]
MLATTKSYNPFAHLASAFSDWSRARVTRNTLSQLSDRELNDIGLCRGDIERIAQRKS